MPTNIIIAEEEGYLWHHPLAKRIYAILNDIRYTQRDVTWMISGNIAWYAGGGLMDEYRPISFRIMVSNLKDVQSGESISLFMPPIVVHPEMKDEWILQTAYRAIRSFELHEMDEHFFYKDEKIFDPHRGETQTIHG